jgi:CheY-like chemotaxis protein
MRSLKLLLVEDDPLSLELMGEVFTSMKAHVRPTNDGEQAAALVAQEKFDGIFLDLEMPKMHGFELAHRIRKSTRNSSTPIIIVTGRDDRNTMPHAFATGATFFLQKPVDRQRLTRLFLAVRGSLFENRRRNARVPLQTEVVCTSGSVTAQGMTWNLSQGGVQIDGGPNLKAGDLVRLSFRLPISGGQIDGFGVVAWASQNRQGIQFTKLSEQNAKAIKTFIAEVETPDWDPKES